MNFATEDGMQILLLAVSGDGHAGGEESDVPQESEADGEAAVRAEDAHRWKGTDNADPERYHVSDGGDGDGDGRLRHHQ